MKELKEILIVDFDTNKAVLYEHKLTNKSETLFCDYCGNLAKNRSPTIYKDSNCNFDICWVCYEKLPETHELVPFKMSKNAIQHLSLKANGPDQYKILWR